MNTNISAANINLNLSLICEKDFDDLFALMNNPEVLDTMVLDYPLDHDEWYDIFKNNPHKAAKGEEFAYSITLKDNNTMVGMCDLLDVNKERKNAELGYLIAPGFRKQGIAFNACTLLIDYAFSQIKLHKIWAETFATNIPSQSLLTKLKFNKVGIKRKEVYKHGKWQDRIVYELLNPET